MAAAIRFKSINDIGKHCSIRSVMPMVINLDCGSARVYHSAQVKAPAKDCAGKRKVGTSKESVWQRKLFDLLVASGHDPEWEFSGAIPKRRFRVDIAFPAAKLAIEVDGWQHHGKTLGAFKSDRKKQNLFVAHGWRVLRFFPGEISKTPEDCINMIEMVLAMNASQLK